VHRDEHVAAFSACEACVEKTTKELATVRPVFDAIIAAGVDRDLANEVMDFLLARHSP
jgi:hypothetical protein